MNFGSVFTFSSFFVSVIFLGYIDVVHVSIEARIYLNNQNNYKAFVCHRSYGVNHIAFSGLKWSGEFSYHVVNMRIIYSQQKNRQRTASLQNAVLLDKSQ